MTSSESLKPYQIVHTLPGRIRLRLPLLKQYPHAAALVQQKLEDRVNITSVRLNLAAQSLVVTYYPALNGEVFQKLLDGVEQIWEEALTPGSSIAPSAPLSSGGLPESGLGLPLLAASLAVLSQPSQLPWLRPWAIMALVGAAWPVVQRAWEGLVKQRRLNIDCLDVLALSLSAAQGRWITPAMVIVLHQLGDWIREQTARATEVRRATLQDTIGRWAWVKRLADEPPEQVPSDRVQVGDLVIVYPGEQIPVDGTILQGEAVIDQQSLTGEAMPVVRREGQGVWASTLVRSGQVYLRAERVGQATRAALSLALLQRAPVHDTRMANYAEKVADRLILPSLMLAGLILLITRDRARAAAILTLDFVTGIRVSIPTAFLGALNHTTRHGMLVRCGRTLEQLAEVDTVVFDKTGTLTQGAIAIVGVTPVAGGMEPDALLQLAAAAEQRLTHPVAQAIVASAESRGIPIPPRGDWLYELGLGVRAEIEGREVLVGSGRFLEQGGVAGIPTEDSQRADAYVYVACDRRFQGVIEYTDPLRPESERLIQILQQDYGMEVHLLTGDHPHRAAQVAQQLGIPATRVYAEAFPDEKARIVRDLHRSGHTVAFVGDGLNDSVALAYADVSVSFEQGSDIARETADVVLMNNQLLDFIEALSIARQTRHLIEQNMALVIIPNLAALGIATTVGLNPLVATAIHNGAAIAAGLNSLRPLVEHQINRALTPTHSLGEREN